MIKLVYQTITGTKPIPSLEEEAAKDALILDRTILENELWLIDKNHTIMAQRAKRKFLADWLMSREPSSTSS